MFIHQTYLMNILYSSSNAGTFASSSSPDISHTWSTQVVQIDVLLGKFTPERHQKNSAGPVQPLTSHLLHRGHIFTKCLGPKPRDPAIYTSRNKMKIYTSQQFIQPSNLSGNSGDDFFKRIPSGFLWSSLTKRRLQQSR